MAKVEVDLVKMVMTRNGLDVRTVAQVIEDINTEMKAQTDDEDKPPPVKKQFVMMVSDPEEVLQGKIMTGWVLQIPEEDSPHVAEERVFRLGYEYNMTKKGRRIPVKTVAEACENVPARIQKEQKVWVKTKEPVYILPTKNKIPGETKDSF
ncbi:MAG: hypothetical protein AAFX93_12490 [Verrucomicrobiota bacterium]